MKIRRVVTGHDAAGKAVFASDEEIDPDGASRGGHYIHQVWGADYQALRFPDDGSWPVHEDQFFPKTGGFRYVMVTMPPDGAKTSPETDDWSTRAPRLSMRQNFKSDFPEGAGMHMTGSIDLEVVISGELTLELDDGATLTMKPGDTIIQNGTKHRWINRGDVPVTFAAIIVGVDHDEFP